MTVRYDFYTSSSRSATSGGTGKVALRGHPTIGGAGLWHGPLEWEYRYPYQPTITPAIPAIIRRKPKKDRWEKYVKDWKKIKKIKELADVTRHIEIRPVIICGWCGARIPRGMEDEPCEYCGS